MLTIESQYPFTQTLNHLVLLHNELRGLLISGALNEHGHISQMFSLFSSKRILRKDELGIGLNTLNHFCEFGKN